MASSEENYANNEDKCTLCQTTTPELHCNTCRNNLCPRCVSEHVTAHLTIQHKIVAYELRDTSIKHPACTSHVNFSCELHCEDCSAPICSQCCTEGHQGHRVTDITELYREKERIIKLHNYYFEKIISEYYNITSEIEIQISILRNGYQKLRTNITKQGEIWHQEVNNVVSKYHKKIDKMEIDCIAMLKKHLSDMQNHKLLVCEAKQKNIDTMNSKDGINLVSYESKLEEMLQTPPLVLKISLPTFTPNEIKHDTLYKQIGYFTDYVKLLTESCAFAMLLDRPKELTTIDTRYKYLLGVSCARTDEVWISQVNSRDIRRISIHNSLQETIKIESEDVYEPYNLTVTKQGHLVYSVLRCGGGEVCQVKQGKTETITRLWDWRPLGVCSTSDGDFLVCMTDKYDTESKVVRFCGATVKQEIMYDDKGKHLYDTGDLFITENTNKDVWVSDYQANAIVVTDQSGKFKFRYTGNLESKKYKTFRPWCIDSDSQGHVLVIDFYNKCVHIIDNKGHLLCYIEHLTNPRDLSVDSNDRVWIVDYFGNVKIVKYIRD